MHQNIPEERASSPAPKLSRTRTKGLPLPNRTGRVIWQRQPPSQPDLQDTEWARAAHRGGCMRGRDANVEDHREHVREGD